MLLDRDDGIIPHMPFPYAPLPLGAVNTALLVA